VPKVLYDRTQRKDRKEAQRSDQQDCAENQRAKGRRIAGQRPWRGRQAGLGCEPSAKANASAAKPYRPASMAIVAVTL
jgi:hypothetical protein